MHELPYLEYFKDMLLDQQYAIDAILTIFVRNSHVLSQVKTRFSRTILTKLEKFKFQMRSAKKKIPIKGMMFVFFKKKKIEFRCDFGLLSIGNFLKKGEGFMGKMMMNLQPIEIILDGINNVC